jgi:hypothetical protein
MIPTDRTEFVKIVMGFAEVRGKQLSLPAVEFYWGAMQDWSIEDFRAGANLLAKTSDFMPQPGDFEKLRKAGRETAVESWARAVAHASSSRYRLGPLGIPRIDMLVAALGGYSAIAQCDESKLHFLERRFTEHFENVQDADDTREAVPQIAFDHTPELKLVSGNFKRIGGRA